MAKKKKFEIPLKTDGWLATYSDMMSLLMCFFVLLFAISSVDAEKFSAFAASFSNSAQQMNILAGGLGDGLTQRMGNGIIEMPMVDRNDDRNTGQGQGGESEFQRLASDFKTYFADSEKGQDIYISENEADGSITITLGDGVLFDSGSADVREEALVMLDYIANELHKFPGLDIEVVGHTDNVPMRNNATYPDNWHLSFGRAISVAQFLIYDKGFSPYQIMAVGRGEHVPVASNDTDVGRAMNRRVEIKIRQPVGAEPFALN
jgi:chemotaxis protein MotB